MNRADLLNAVQNLDPVQDADFDHRTTERLLLAIDERALKSRGWPIWQVMRTGPALAILFFLLILVLTVPIYLLRSQSATPASSSRYIPPGVVTYIPIGAGAGVRTVATSPDGHIWVMSANERILYEVDPEAGVVVDTHVVDGYVEGTPIGGGSVWLLSWEPPAILRFDPNAGLFNGGGVVDRIELSEPPVGGIWAFDSLWITNESGRLLRFDEEGTATGDFPIDTAGPGARFLSASDDSLWMASPNGLVYRIDPSNGTILRRIEVVGEVRAVTVGAGFVWVSEVTRDVLVKIDPVTNQVVAETEVARIPHSLTVAGSSVWVSNLHDYTISEIDVDSADMVRTVALPGRPASLVSVGDSLWVSLYRAAALVEIDPGPAMLEMPETGRLDQVVTIDDRAIRVLCTGSGSPTIVLEADASEGAGSWSMVQAMISGQFRVCSTDRSGSYAVADYSASAATGDADLYEALAAAGEPGPYVLVGHGQGSHVVRAFATDYRAAVVGIVLVDPEPEQFLEQAATILPESMLRSFLEHLFAGETFGELRLEGFDQNLGALPAVIIRADTDFLFGPGGDLDAAASERLREAWHTGQEELTAISSQAVLFEADGSDHFVQYSRPDLIVDAIIELAG